MRLENSPAGTFCVPLNIMCSSTCATPVVPLNSSMAPARYHTCDTITGARWSSCTITRMPLSSVTSVNAACALLASSANPIAHRLRMFPPLFVVSQKDIDPLRVKPVGVACQNDKIQRPSNSCADCLYLCLVSSSPNRPPLNRPLPPRSKQPPRLRPPNSVQAGHSD